jgi:cytochrome bd-type quinol oxidase subunit 2
MFRNPAVLYAARLSDIACKKLSAIYGMSMKLWSVQWLRRNNGQNNYCVVFVWYHVLAIAMITTYGGSMFPEIPYNDDTHP